MGSNLFQEQLYENSILMFLFRLRTSLCCYIAQHFYSIVVLYSELPMQVMCSICIVLFTWNYNQTYNQKKCFSLLSKEKPRFDISRNFMCSFPTKYSVIKIFQYNVDESFRHFVQTVLWEVNFV